MEFDSYCIKTIDGDKHINLVDIDKMICDELNLVYSDDDYGHYYFTYQNKGKKVIQDFRNLFHG